MPADAYAVHLPALVTVLAEGYGSEQEAREAAMSGAPGLIVLSERPVSLTAVAGKRLQVEGSVELCGSAGLPEPVKALLTALLMHLADEPLPPPARARQRDALTSDILDQISDGALRLNPPPMVQEEEA